MQYLVERLPCTVAIVGAMNVAAIAVDKWRHTSTYFTKFDVESSACKWIAVPPCNIKDDDGLFVSIKTNEIWLVALIAEWLSQKPTTHVPWYQT